VVDRGNDRGRLHAHAYGLRKALRDIRWLGQYTLERKLGEGGTDVVYRASHATHPNTVTASATHEADATVPN
jgi:hypothetical protein